MYANGDVYEGDMKAGAVTGVGIKTFASGDKYEGDLKLAALAVVGVVGTGALAILLTSAL